MILLLGPIPRIQYKVILPNPRRANVEEANDSLIWHKTQESVFYTYARVLADKHLKFEVYCTRTVADILQDFYTITQGKQIKLVDHRGKKYQGYILSPEIDFSESLVRQISGSCTELPNAGEISFEFFGRQI